MIKKEQITKIATLLKIKESEFEAALKDTNEVDIAIPEVSVFTTEELTTRDANHKSQGYKEGGTAKLEMMVKEQKEKLGLEFEGKDAESLIKAVQDKALKDAKVEPNTKITELNSVIEKQKKTIEDFGAEKNTLLSQISGAKQDAQLLGMLPGNRLEVLQDTEYLSAIKTRFTFTEEDGKPVVKEGDKVLRDSTTQAPLDPKTVINNYFGERKWIGEQADHKKGRGEGNDTPPGGVHLKLSEIEKSFKEQGKSLNGIEFSSAVEAAQKANPTTFDLNS